MTEHNPNRPNEMMEEIMSGAKTGSGKEAEGHPVPPAMEDSPRQHPEYLKKWQRLRPPKDGKGPVPPVGPGGPPKKGPGFLKGPSGSKMESIKKYLIIALVAVVLLVVAGAGIRNLYLNSKLREVGVDSAECEGMDYSVLRGSLEESGFTNIHGLAVNDLEYNDLSQEGKVFFIAIDDTMNFRTTSKYYYDSDIFILFHSAKTVTCPMTIGTAQGMTPEEVAETFVNAGFVEVELVANPDLTFGIFHKDGEVQSITIDGNSTISTASSYRVDAEVVITYHTFKNKK